MADRYVAPWGNDNNDGLTWDTAKRSLQAGLSLISNEQYVYCKGLLKYANRNDIASNISGDGITTKIWHDSNVGLGGGSGPVFYKTIICSNIISDRPFTYAISGSIKNGNIIKNATNASGGNPYSRMVSSLNLFVNTQAYLYGVSNNNTCFKMPYLQIGLYSSAPKNNIFAETNVYYAETILDNCKQLCKDTKYTLFINSPIKLYTETSFTLYATIEDLRAKCVTLFGGVPDDYFFGCKIYNGSYNDIFVDADNGNFHLKVGNPVGAERMTFEGTYIGKYCLGKKVDVSDFTLTNIGTDGTVTDQLSDASFTSSPIVDLGRVYTIVRLDNIGNIAYRNGMNLNVDEMLGSPISAGTDVLEDGSLYVVIAGSITVTGGTGTTFSEETRFVATSAVGLSFSTSDGGYVQKITQTLFQPSVIVKTSLSDALLSTATPIKLDLYNTPYVNVDSNSEPTLGNRDTGFSSATQVQLKCRYIQFVTCTIYANELKHI